MKKKFETWKIITDFLTSLACIVFITWVLLFCYTFISVWKACSETAQIPQQEFVRIRIYGSSTTMEGNTISAEFSIVDTNGNEIAAIERSWSGNYLGIEFASLEFNNNIFLFPSRIYGKERIMENSVPKKRSTTLQKYYNENNQCMLLGFGSTYEERNRLYKISSFATGKYPFPGFGHVNNYSLDLSSCKIDTWYSIHRDSAGNLMVVEF